MQLPNVLRGGTVGASTTNSGPTGETDGGAVSAGSSDEGGSLPPELEEVTSGGGGSPDDEEEDDPLSKDTLFEILKNRRRRDALRYLRTNGGSADLGELAEHIAAKENGIDVRQLSSDQRKRVYIGLYQCHLPKMNDAGVVDFDKDRGDIELLDSASQLYPYVESESEGREADEEGPFPLHKFALPTAAGLVVVGGLAGAPLVGGLDAAWLAGFSAVVLLVMAALEWRRELG